VKRAESTSPRRNVRRWKEGAPGLPEARPTAKPATAMAATRARRPPAIQAVRRRGGRSLRSAGRSRGSTGARKGSGVGRGGSGGGTGTGCASMGAMKR
jgi:hypothetical protein